MPNGAPDGIALLQGATLVDALSYEGAITEATIGGKPSPLHGTSRILALS